MFDLFYAHLFLLRRDDDSSSWCRSVYSDSGEQSTDAADGIDAKKIYQMRKKICWNENELPRSNELKFLRRLEGAIFHLQRKLMKQQFVTSIVKWNDSSISHWNSLTTEWRWLMRTKKCLPLRHSTLFIVCVCVMHDQMKHKEWNRKEKGWTHNQVKCSSQNRWNEFNSCSERRLHFLLSSLKWNSYKVH